MKSNIFRLLTAAALLFAGQAWAQSSKFAAEVAQAGSNLHLLHSGKAVATVSGQTVTEMNEDVILQAVIKTAKKKDLLIGVSLQNGLYTKTVVKGRLGSYETANAEGGIQVRVEIDDGTLSAYPDKVTFARRYQELSATLGGVIEKCNVSVTDTDGDGTSEGEIIIARDCVVTDETIGLILDTTSANHFNFVAPNMTPGTHTVRVYAKAMSSAEFVNGSYCPVERNPDGTCPVDEITTTNNEAAGWALVDVGTLTVEEVRAINQEGGIVIDDNAGCYDNSGNYVCDER